MTRRGLLAVALLMAAPASAQERLSLVRPGGGSLDLRAQTLVALDQGDRLEASGQVVILWEGHRLMADRVAYWRDEARAEAEGEVTLEDPDGNVLRGQRLSLELDSQRGEVTQASLWIAREGYRVWGERLRKTGPQSYELEDGGFTACDGTWPSWRVEADRVEVELEGYLVGRGAAFWVEGAPVAYTPYILFPVKRERQSGFLIPKAGFSNRQGLLGVLRYYWAFADSADATLRLEYRSRRGLTEGAELRYVLAEGHEGTAEGVFLRDRQEERSRYRVKADHRSRFSDVSRARFKLDYLGDRSYLRDVGDTLDERGVSQLETFALATRDREEGTLFGLVDFLQDLNEPQSDVLQTLPSVGFLGRETPLPGHAVWQPTARATRFWRAEGTTGERLELSPSLGAELGLGGVGLSARAGYRQHLYAVDGETTARGAARAEAATFATWARGYGALVHTLEPGVRLFWEEAGRGGSVPSFDDQDVFVHQASVGFLASSRLLRRSDLGSVLSLDVERRLDPATGEWTPWRGEAAAWVGDRFSLRGDGELDPGQSTPWLRWSAGADATDRRGDRVFAQYRYLKGEASYADGGAQLALTSALALQYRHRYSSRDHRTLEEAYGVHLFHSCWELLVTFSRNLRIDDDQDERRYFASLNLKGLGRIGTLRGILP